jgi:hypothetical protein
MGTMTNFEFIVTVLAVGVVWRMLWNWSDVVMLLRAWTLVGWETRETLAIFRKTLANRLLDDAFHRQRCIEEAAEDIANTLFWTDGGELQIGESPAREHTVGTSRDTVKILAKGNIIKLLANLDARQIHKRKDDSR